MLNFKKLLTVLGLASMTVLAACSGVTGADGDATDGTGSDATTGTDATGSDATGGDTAGGDTTVVPVTYKSVVIWDKSQDPSLATSCGKSPGTDLDAIGLYRNNVLIGVGKPGTAVFVPAPAAACVADTGKDSASSAEGPLDAHVYAKTPDKGYISLAGGSLELQFGACATGSTITDCDGKGALVDVQSGDQLDVYEVDNTYWPTANGGAGPEAGNAYYNSATDKCACYADEYQVDFRTTLGSEAGAAYVPADPKQYDKGTMTVTAP